MSVSYPFTFALPAGRLAEESIEFFNSVGLAEFDYIPKERILTLLDKEKKFRILLVRSQDVPTYVLQGGADGGIVGRDVLIEGEYDITVPFNLKFGQCRLSVATLPEESKYILQRSNLRVATKYPRLATDFFYRSGIACEIIKLHGSLEIAPLLSLADCIVDLVSTGETLKQNGLVEVAKIIDSCATFIVNRSTYAIKTKQLSKIFYQLQRHLNKDR